MSSSVNRPPLTEGLVARMAKVIEARQTANNTQAGIIYSLFVASFPNKTDMIIEMMMEFTEIIIWDLLSDMELNRK